MNFPQQHTLFFPLLFLTLISSILPCFSQNDTAALLEFRSQSDPYASLSNWSTSDACSSNWVGVRCSKFGRIFSLSLPSYNLRGSISSLSNLDQLRILDLSDNRLNGSISPVLNCTNLKLVYLHHNDFSYELPSHIGILKRLRRLDVSYNNLHGSLPLSLSNLTRLLTLRLQNNALSGRVSDFAETLPQLKELNLSNNELFGRLPSSYVQRFGVNSFLGNQALCGQPLLSKCSLSDHDNVNPSSLNTSQTFPSNPSDYPLNITSSGAKPTKGSSHGAVTALVVTNSILILIVVSFVAAFCCRKCGFGSENKGVFEGGEDGKRKSNEKRVYASNSSTIENNRNSGNSDSTSGSDKSKFVFFDKKKQFELEDLLRASAEMLGKGSLGTVYRAVLDDGNVVAVKRLKDANPCARKEFEQYMDVIGRLKHPNIVKLRAYYYAPEEKLLVYDYLANGSLHSLIHGNRGPGRIPLDWTTRLSLVLGAARGLARIHTQYNSTKIPHGNVKSCNILLDKNGVACISDFGLSLLLNPAHAIARLGGYKAPEQTQTNSLSQEADVYSFGVVLLEVLTGKAQAQFPSQARPNNSLDPDEQPADLPKWVRSVVRDEWTAEVFDPELLRYKNIEDELVAMLHLGLACAVSEPEKRPEMVHVVKLIEEIRVEQSPVGEDYDDSRNSLSPSIPTTEEAVSIY